MKHAIIRLTNQLLQKSISGKDSSLLILRFTGAPSNVSSSHFVNQK